MNEEERTKLVESVLEKITSDISYGAPEAWERTKAKVRARLDGMTRHVERSRSRLPVGAAETLDSAAETLGASTLEDARIVRQLLSDFVPTTHLHVPREPDPGLTILGDALERFDRLMADRRWGGWKWNETDLSAVAGPYHENEDLLEMLLGPELVNATARVVDDPTGFSPAVPKFVAYGNPCRVVIRCGVETSLDDAIEGVRVVFAQQGENFPPVTEDALRKLLEKWGAVCLVWIEDPRGYLPETRGGA